MSVPRRIRVGYRDIKVELSPSLPGDTDGYCDTERHAIVVRDQLDDSDVAVTILHELLHHLIHRAGGADAIGIDSATEERLVSILSAGVSEAAARNESAAAWFVECVGR